MKKFVFIPVLFLLVFIIFFYGCNQSNKQKNNNETILKGSTSILVDETLLPIIEDQVEVFESLYAGSKIKLIAKSESESVSESYFLAICFLVTDCLFSVFGVSSSSG